MRLLASMPGEHHAIDLLPKPADLPQSFYWHQIDLLKGDDLESLMADIRPQRLLHLAWITSHGEYWRSLLNFHWVEASLRLLRAFCRAGGTRFVGAGSCAEYDWKHGFLSEEVTPLNPTTVYGSCKKAMYELLKQYAEAANFSYAWGRLFFLYGPGEHPSRLMPYTISNIAAGRVANFGSGERIRDYLRVEDAAAAFVKLLENDFSGPINIASGEPVTIRSIVNAIAAELGRSDLVRIGTLPTEKSDPLMIVGDARKLRLFWSPEFSMQSGLRSMVLDYLKTLDVGKI